MINYQHLQDQHGGCGCVILPVLAGAGTGTPYISKDNCRIYVHGLLFAIDCDLCQAFDIKGRMKPDLVIFRKCGSIIDLFVAEIKNTLYKKALKQVKDGCKTLLSSSLFPGAKNCRIGAIFAQKRPLQEAVIQKYRGPLDLNGISARSDAYQCGAEIIHCNR